MTSSPPTEPFSLLVRNIGDVAAAIVKVGVLPLIAIILVVVGAWTLPAMRDELVLYRLAMDRQNKLMEQDVAAHEAIARAVQKTCVVLAGLARKDPEQCLTH